MTRPEEGLGASLSRRSEVPTRNSHRGSELQDCTYGEVGTIITTVISLV